MMTTMTQDELRRKTLLWRRKYGVNKSQMARLLNLSRTAYINWEKGSEMHENNRLRLESLLEGPPPKMPTTFQSEPMYRHKVVPKENYIIPRLPTPEDFLALISRANATGRMDIVQRLAHLTTHMYSMSDEINAIRESFEEIRDDLETPKEN